MYFTGGLIPFFILITKLGLYDNFLVMILPYMVTIWNIILVRTFFMGIPEALHESAVIDGANDLLILSKIIVPLSKSILAVIALYSAVGIWNSWFYAMIFLPNRNLHPLQLFLAKLLVFEAPNITNANQEMLELLRQQQSTVLQMKYAVIMFATVPIMCMYPFLQKYFIKGTLIGSLKE
jgi:putative aldouronate transport system permease protein